MTEIRHVIRGNRLEIYLIGELDEHSSDRTRESLDELIKASDKNVVVFNLKNLKFMDSTGIGILLGRYKKHNQCNMCIGETNSYIDKILRTSGIFQIFNKIEE